MTGAATARDRALTLRHADWTAIFRPQIGGAIAALRHRGEPVLRESAPDADAPLEMACFPLVPYANRIAHGRFHHGGREWRLPRNFGAHPHALHGIGWLSAWTEIERGAHDVVLEHVHRGGASWPWPYRATQRIALDERGVDFTLGVESCADVVAPMGLGFHPAFPAAADTVLQTEAGRVWLADANCLPTVRAPADHFADWRAGARVRRADLVDNCYEGWSGRAALITATRATVVTASTALRWLHVYIPPHRDFCCLEPVSHMPDAVNRARADATTGLDLLEPGDVRTVAMRIEVVDTARD